jgi:type IV secretory pathway VirB10-like protein
MDATDSERSFLQRNRIAIGVVLTVMIGLIVMAVKTFSGHSAPPRRESTFTMVSLPPPPPPPPPPPVQPPPPQEQKMMEQTPVNEPEQKAEEKPEPPAPALGTGIKGNGPADGFGLGGSNGSGILGGRNPGGTGSKFGWYAGQVQTKVADALRNHRKTRSASINGIRIRIWPDATGRVNHAQVVGTTGDAAVDDAIKNEVLTGLQLQEPPPPGMPTPIVMRLTARRPN